MKNTCIDCGKDIGSTSTRCRVCSCKASAEKNSAGLKKAYAEGRKKPAGMAAVGHPACGMGSLEWREQNKEKWAQAIEKQRSKTIGVSKKGHPHTEQFKREQSIRMTERLRDPEKRKNYGRGKKSHMELYFENWLFRNKIEGWEAEKHFWNSELKKNYFVDFLFEDRKLIIELDGTQHRKTVELDRVRDEWLTKQGYKVIRLSYEEYRKGLWEKDLVCQIGAMVTQQI